MGEPIVHRAGIMISLAVLALAGPARAHHSIAAQYDRDRAVSFTGQVVRIELVNPHSSIDFEVRLEDGARASWTIESSGAAGMRRMGMTGDALSVGDEVKVIAYPARSGANQGWLTRLETPDRVFEFGMRSGGAPEPTRLN
jgi:Family of unknown function (DUF6152)